VTAGRGRRRLDRRTLVTAVLAAVALGLILEIRLNQPGSAPAPPPARPTAADLRAPAWLVAAARRVGFHTSTEPGVGLIESKPASAARPPSSSALLPVGSVAPRFTLRTPEGDPVSLSSYRGRAVLLEFFATWCPHCQAEAPHLRRIARELGFRRYAYLSINGDGETAPSVYAFHRYFGLPYPALLDPGGRPGSFSSSGEPGPVSKRYGLQNFPTFYVIRPDGRIAWRSDGEQPDALLVAELRRAAG
jgi:peroxiredoxin